MEGLFCQSAVQIFVEYGSTKYVFAVEHPIRYLGLCVWGEGAYLKVSCQTGVRFTLEPRNVAGESANKGRA